MENASEVTITGRQTDTELGVSHSCPCAPVLHHRRAPAGPPVCPEARLEVTEASSETAFQTKRAHGHVSTSSFSHVNELRTCVRSAGRAATLGAGVRARPAPNVGSEQLSLARTCSFCPKTVVFACWVTQWAIKIMQWKKWP